MVVCWVDRNYDEGGGGVPQQLWVGVDAGKSDHHCVAIDADGNRLLSQRCPTMRRCCWN